MGAAIQVEGDTAYILGRPPPRGPGGGHRPGGAALTVAALGAQGAQPDLGLGPCGPGL